MLIRYYCPYANCIFAAETDTFSQFDSFERTADPYYRRMAYANYRFLPIDIKYGELGGSTPGSKNPLGKPIGDSKPGPDNKGIIQRYENGFITWLAEIGAHAIWGPIADKWWKMKDVLFLGYPITDLIKDESVGYHAEFQNGKIYHTEATGTNEVHGPILQRYKALGEGQGVLGYPVSDETETEDGKGRYNLFTFGRIYWAPSIDPSSAWEVHGPILQKYESLGAEKDFLGYPISGVKPTDDGKGVFGAFQGGFIFSSPAYGAHEVHGEILDEYIKQGSTSKLGFPVTDVLDLPGVEGGQISSFEFGSIKYEPGKGVSVVYAS